MKGSRHRECPCDDPKDCRRKDSTNHPVRYVVRYEKPAGPDGQRRQGKKRFRTADEADTFLAGQVTAVAQGTYVDPSRDVLSTYLRAWLKRKARTLRPGTIADYAWRLETMVIPHIGSVRLGDVRIAHLDHMFDEIAEDEAHDVGPTSLHSILAVLSSALGEAEEREQIARNPCRHYGKRHLPPKSTPKVKPWTPAQTSAFLAAVAGERDALLWRLYAVLGLRRGEGIGLRWSDVDLDAGRLAVRQAVTLAGGKVVVGKPKTKAGEDRVAVLDAGTIAGLKAHRKAQAAERLKAGSVYEDNGLIFCDEIGRMIKPPAVSHRFRQLAAAAGLPRVRLHDLRHGAVSMLIAVGIPLPVVSKLVGHASTKTTGDLYGHLVEGTAVAAADAVAALLSGTSAVS
ncbi:Integrase [Parafrankia sp. Ea1.12]|nr:Integrase [Parafrankia sp. Ea1.12]